MDLPVTLRIKSAPGRPTDRQLMSQIQAAATWKELEAVVHQQRMLSLPTTRAAAGAAVVSQQRTLPTTPAVDVKIEESSAPAAAAAAASKDTTNPQQQQQWTMDSQLPRRQPRRRQVPKPLSVEPQSAESTPPAAVAAASSSKQLPSRSAAAAAAFGDQGPVAKPSDLLNYLHVTEAIRRLPLLLPRNPGQLAAADRSRAAALVELLNSTGNSTGGTTFLYLFFSHHLTAHTCNFANVTPKGPKP